MHDLWTNPKERTMARTKPAKSKSPSPGKKTAGLNPVASSARIDIGIGASDRKEIAEGLSRYLSDAFTLYLKTHNFHWNVTGPMFNSLHVMFEQQYTEQWNALDEVAERTRALGFNTPGSYA
jgi:starvation-inducible DNA-binding protein